MLQPHHTATLVGPFRRPGDAMQAVTAQLAVDHLHPTDAPTAHARCVTALRIAGRHWIDVGALDRVIARLLLADSTLFAYRCALQRSLGFDARGEHGFIGERCRMVVAPGRTMPIVVDFAELEHHRHPNPRLEDAWALAADLVHGRAPSDPAQLEPVERLEQRWFDVREHGVRPRVVKVRRALADAAELTLERGRDGWEIRMTMADGSRRMIVIDDADLDALALDRK